MEALDNCVVFKVVTSLFDASLSLMFWFQPWKNNAILQQNLQVQTKKLHSPSFSSDALHTSIVDTVLRESPFPKSADIGTMTLVEDMEEPHQESNEIMCKLKEMENIQRRECFSAPTGKGSDKTHFNVEKCPMCRAPIRLDLTPSITLRDIIDQLDIASDERKEKIEQDLAFLKRHSQCIRLGAHCTTRMCLRPRAAVKPNVPNSPDTANVSESNETTNSPLESS